MMRAPTYIAPLNPVEAYKARFLGPGTSPLGSTVGRALALGSATLNQFSAQHSAIQAITDDTAGRARALQDRAALTNLVDLHAGLNGGDAVASQPQALDELAKIQANGQTRLATPGMIAAYDQQMGPAIDDATNQITGHALRQAVVERQAVADQELQSAQQAAANTWQDPARLIAGLNTVKAIAASQTGETASPNERMAAVRSAVGTAVANAVGQAFAAGEPEFAAHIMGGWGDTLAPATYQLAIAKLGQANQAQRMASIFGDVAGGNPRTAVVDSPVTQSPGTVAIDAPAGAAVHPIAGGTVSAIGGTPNNATVEILHPDGSTTAYGGLGMAAAATGDLVTPTHVIGSASPVVTLAANTPSGDAIDAGKLLRNAGGAGAVIGQSDTPRIWDIPALLDRIAQRNDLSPDDQALAANFAQRRMAADHMQQAANDVSAGRSVVSLFAAAPDSMSHAADLPPDLAGQLSPAALAQVDGALRNVAHAATTPTPDNPSALRLELEQRQAPGVFAQRNLAPFIGEIHPADLAQLASDQGAIAAGSSDAGPPTSRSAILDAIARHEVVNTATLPNGALPGVKTTAETMMRINQIDPSDRTLIDNTVADAIQRQSGQS